MWTLLLVIQREWEKAWCSGEWHIQRQPARLYQGVVECKGTQPAAGEVAAQGEVDAVAGRHVLRGGISLSGAGRHARETRDLNAHIDGAAGQGLRGCPQQAREGRAQSSTHALRSQ